LLTDEALPAAVHFPKMLPPLTQSRPSQEQQYDETVMLRLPHCNFIESVFLDEDLAFLA
jgi:hypothetical protein